MTGRRTEVHDGGVMNVMDAVGVIVCSFLCSLYKNSINRSDTVFAVLCPRSF